MTAKSHHLANNNKDMVQTSSAHEADLLAEAAGLINPHSGIANDYLNHYNEVLLLVENLPVLLPEMIEELLTWKPKSYQKYFNQSPLPGAAAAIEVYENHLDHKLRNLFETCIARINRLALASIAVIAGIRDAEGEVRSQDVENFCHEASAEMRAAIEVAADLVNHGLKTPSESPQSMADRILASFVPAPGQS